MTDSAAVPPPSRTVAGRIVDADGLPVVGAVVHANARSVGSADRGIAYATTDADGSYRLQVGSAPDSAVVISVVGPTATVESPPLLDATGDHRVDLVLSTMTGTAPSRFTTVSTLLAGQSTSVDVSALTPADVALLVAAGSVDGATVRSFAVAHGIAEQTGVSPEVAFALVQQGVTPDAAAVAALSPQTVQQAVAAAVAAGTVSATAADQVGPSLAALDRSVVAQPVFLTAPATFFASTAAAAQGTDDSATLIKTRLDAALRRQVLLQLPAMSQGLSAAVDAQLATLDYAGVLGSTVDPTTGAATGSQDGATIGSVASDVLTRAATSPELQREAATILAGLPPVSPSVSDALQLDSPVSANSLLAGDLTRAKAAAYVAQAGLEGTEARAVLVGAATVLDTDGGVDGLIAAGALSDASGARLQGVVDLALLTGDNTALISALQQRSDSSARALAGWNAQEWLDLLTSSQSALPTGETVQSYSRNLMRNLELTFPSQALIGRVRDQQLTPVLQSNPDLDLRLVDLTTADGADAALDWTGVASADRSAVQATLQSYQRLIALTDQTDTQVALLASGHHSAVSIAALTEEELVTSTGLSAADAHPVYVNAQENALKVAHAYGAVRDLVHDLFKNLGVGNVDPQAIDDLRKIEGFADLFGSQDFCNCDDCHSVLSPAAYFVDLMHFVEVNVSRPTFVSPGRTTHPLYLKVRRPDLWTLQLTCDNTNTLIPYLTIVDEVLEAYLDGVVGTDIYTVLADPAQKLSFTEPFNLPWSEIVLYLSHFSLAPADVMRTLGGTDADVRRARTGLSPDEYDVVITADPAGVVNRIGNPGSLANFPVQSLLRSTGLSRAELDQLIALRSFPDLAGLSVTHQVTPDELQNFPELLTGLTAGRLDVIHRYVRLARRIGWTLPDLDTVLSTLQAAGLTGTDIDASTIDELGELLTVQPMVRMSNVALTALVGDLPVSSAFPLKPAHDSDKQLYEQLFDLPALFGVKDPNTGELNQSVQFHHYSLDTADPTDTTIDPKTPLLLGALGVSETELLLLMGLLKDSMPFDVNGNCTLDRAKLSLLYRHVAVAQALRLPIDDFIRSLQLIFAAPDQTLSGLDRIETLVTFRSWLKSSRLDTATLLLVLDGTETPGAKFVNTPDTTAALVQQVQALGAIGRLDLLRSQLTGSLSITAAELTDLESWLADPLSTPAIAAALEATFTAGVPDNPALLEPLTTSLREIERVLLVTDDLKMGAADIGYVTAHAAELGIPDRTALTLQGVQGLAFYRSQSVLRPDGAALVQQALDAYAAAGTVTAGADRARLAELWHVDQSLVDSLIDVVPAQPVASDALSAYARVLSMCVVLGVNAYSLQILGNDVDFAALTAAVGVALGCFTSKYADPAVRATTLEPYTDQVNVLKRDALCDYIIARQPTLDFGTHDDIYNYFLLDVDMSGCFRTSRVVAAISSAQLYVQRCLTNLEQSNPALAPAIAVVKVSPSAVPADEWDWRKNYRVWEANRKVFLYPESYIDPTLRDDKSPAFEDLENTLMQGSVTKDTAEAAYQHYLTEFANLTHLTICGSLYDPPTSTYYFFGRTQQDPPSFYSRSWVGQTTWTPWVKIDLAIEAPTVSAALYRGRMHLFWVTGKSKDHTSITNGSSQLEYYDVTVGLTYSAQTPEGKWLAPQKLDWLYPSDTETISAQAKVFSDDALNEMMQSKSYLRTYPYVSGDQLILRYYNPQLNANYYFDRRLDLFHNKLRSSGGAIPGLPPATAVILFAGSGKAALGIEKDDFGSEQNFDLQLEQPKEIVTGHTLVTSDFGYTSFSSGQADTTYVMQYVAGGYPESVFDFGEQQFLIHVAPTIRQYAAALSSYADDVRVGQVSQAAEKAFNGLFHGPGTMHTLALQTGLYLGTSVDEKFSAAALANRDSLIRVKRRLIRLSTSLADDLGEILLSSGLDGLLTLQTQMLHEKAMGITFTSLSELGPPADDPNHLDLKGAFGGYYSELFLQIPWLISHHLTAGNQFEDAKWWFDRVFDPTADESSLDARETDRVWRYVGFRNLTTPTLQQILTDQAAIDAYKKDPFNPHAIARLRPSAYQKAVVMQYVDNLLDWGDSLFAQDTMESINEATMLYVLALEILGPRPVQLGTCDTAADADLTYDKLGPLVDAGSEFLLQLETWSYVLGWTQVREVDGVSAVQTVLGHGVANAVDKVAAKTTFSAVQQLTRVDTLAKMLSDDKIDFTTDEARVLAVNQDAVDQRPAASVTIGALTDRVSPSSYAAVVNRRVGELIASQRPPESLQPVHRWPVVQVVTQSTLVFCVPPNDVLMAYWDRVQDRLYKIRNCMNISGVRRSLSLFSPEIDPMALVRARAAGISLDDALAAMSGPLPPYRFVSLIDRARQAAQTVQSFGATLLSALEKKDAEELTLLRSLHEQTVLQMTTQVRTKQLEEAQDSLQAAVEASANVQLRIDYYSGLISAGLDVWEITQQALHGASVLDRIGEAGLNMSAAILYLVPQVGSPFAMKYGGQELGHSLAGFGAFSGTMAGIFEGMSSAASSMATYTRRNEEWKQQLATAQQELLQYEQQRLAAAARVDMMTQELAIHQTTIDQAAELDAFYKDKFTNLGLYDYLATTLNRVYRAAYDAAYQLATMAADSYRFEQDDDTIFLAPDNWQADKAGLLAGERLALQLQQMENAYLTGHARTFEITQSFSLRMLAPDALLSLRTTGSCEFTIPEIAFDLAYPGTYKRLIKAARLSIPCVAGPYTNVSAKLSLTQSKVRKVATIDPGDLLLLPVRTTPSIATSTAQADSGMFEFSFRDDRFLPFEGAGAVSTWRLELPSLLRSFDYDSMSDVILHLSYTALDDDVLRDTVEAQIADELTAFASSTGLQRLFSLRQDFPDAYYLLTHQAAGAQSVQIELGPAQFPYFLSSLRLQASGATAYLEPTGVDPVDVTGLTLRLDTSSGNTWTTPTGTVLQSTPLAISGPLAKKWTLSVPAGQVDPAEVADILLLIQYTAT